MRAPEFWNIKEGRDAAFALRTILWPFSLIYNFFTQKRINETTPVILDVPVISIGNLTLGGTGKTPLAEILREKLSQKIGQTAIVSRGYKGKIIDPIKVDPQNHTAIDVGDEPLMLAQTGLVYIGKDRAEAANLAIKDGIKAIILDDAHQNPALFKDISIVVVDGAVGFGNGYIFPSGPLREKPQIGLKRAEIVVWIGDKALAKESLKGFAGRVYYAQIKPENKKYEGKYLAFCGIGRPQKFEDTLRQLNIELLDLIPFPDHHQFSENEIANLKLQAQQMGAKLITTEKDLARLNAKQKENIEIVKIKIEFENQSDIDEILQTTNTSQS